MMHAVIATAIILSFTNLFTPDYTIYAWVQGRLNTLVFHLRLN